ncbi:MAG TPA: TRAP transporter small permease [Acetobacteraceae bacterium]
MRRVLAIVDAAIMGLVVVLWAAFFLCVVAQVFVRYVLQLPLPWTDEVARYAFVWSSFLSASVILGRGQHFSIDVVVGHLPRIAAWIIELIGTALCLAFTLILMQKSAAWAWRLSYARSSVLELPLGVVYAVLPFSAGYMSIHLAGRLVGLLDRGAGGRRPSW